MFMKEMICHGTEQVHIYLNPAVRKSYPVTIRINYRTDFKRLRPSPKALHYRFHIG